MECLVFLEPPSGKNELHEYLAKFATRAPYEAKVLNMTTVVYNKALKADSKALRKLKRKCDEIDALRTGYKDTKRCLRALEELVQGFHSNTSAVGE